MRGNFVAGRHSGRQAVVRETDQPTVTTKGRVLDHVGFDVNDLDAFLKKAEAAGVKPAVAGHQEPDRTACGSPSSTDPWGTYIELNQRPNQVYLDQM